MGASISNCDSCKSVQTIHSICARSETEIIKLLIIGLDNAGKTTTVKNLLGESLNDVVPTIGFSTVTMNKHKRFAVELYDLGGSRSIRDIWKNYYAFVHGLIYVIDSSDASRIDEIKNNLIKVLSNDKVTGKPLLVLINKQDCADSIDEVELCSQLDLEAIVNKYKCPTKIESCSALYNGFKLKKDVSILNAYKWLLEYIELNWSQLGDRVRNEADSQLREEKRTLELRARKFRRKSDEIESISEVNLPYKNGNPFKPINKIVPLDTNDVNDAFNNQMITNRNTITNTNAVNGSNGYIKSNEINEIVNNVTVAEIHKASVYSNSNNSNECLLTEDEKPMSYLQVSNGVLQSTPKSRPKSIQKRSNTAFKNKISPSIDASVSRRLSH